MIVKVRTHPLDVFYLTGNDAYEARCRAWDSENESDEPCFTTSSYGDDGFAWDTCEEFEEDYEASFGPFVPNDDTRDRNTLFPQPLHENKSE